MTTQSCDRCGMDITNKKSAAVNAVEDADLQRNGDITNSWDLCQKCYDSLKTWIAHSFERKRK